MSFIRFAKFIFVVFAFIAFGLYHPLVANPHSDHAKAPGLNDRKRNMDRLAIVQPRELSRGQNGDLQLEDGIKAHDLVEVRLINPNILVEMRYAGENNPLGIAIYPFSGCFLVREVAEQLSRVQRDLEKEGFGLKIFDAYRPYSMQPALWVEEVSSNKCIVMKCPVEDEAGHNRGTAVDVTLVCLSGYELEMPSDFGDTSEKARGDCRTHDAHVFHNKYKLEQAMKRQGFCPSPHEWWHFDYCGWSCYPILDVKFEELVNFQPSNCW